MLSHTDALKAVEAIAAELGRRKKGGAIALADSCGELVAVLRVGDIPLSSTTIAINKAWTAARERTDTAAIGRAARDAKAGFDIQYYGDPRYVGWGGGIPLWRGGQVIGAIGISGLPDEDEEVQLAEIGRAALHDS